LLGRGNERGGGVTVLEEVRALCEAARIDDSHRGLRAIAISMLWDHRVPIGPGLSALDRHALEGVLWVGLLGDERIAALASMPYRDYLATPEWGERAAYVKMLAGGQCQLCPRTFGLQAHHRTYARRGAERWQDLTELCASCHVGFHDR
jgi:hypothetical protein